MGTQLRGRGSAADHATVRRHNLALVLGHLRNTGPSTRARVAEATGLNKATVSSLVTELVGRDLIDEGDRERGGVGRPGQAISVGGHTVLAVGVEINIDYVSALVVDLTGTVVAERRITIDGSNSSSSAVLARAARLVNSLLQRARTIIPHGSPVGLTIAVPGLVEQATGTLHDAPNLGWRNVRVVEQFRRHLHSPDYPLRLDNEANLAALAEFSVRPDDGAQDVVLLTGGAGVGAGVIADGRLVRGGRGYAGEVGHMPLDPGGRECGCGRLGCWETVVGLNALLARAADVDDVVRDPSLDLEQRLSELNHRAATGDDRTLTALDEVGTWLGRGVTVLIDILNPEVVVLGGYFGALGTWFAEPLRAEIESAVFAPHTGGCRVEVSPLGFSAAVLGGALESLETVYDNPTVVSR